MNTRRTFIAGVASAAAAELAWARCGSRPTQQIVLTGRISAIGAESMELERRVGFARSSSADVSIQQAFALEMS